METGVQSSFLETYIQFTFLAASELYGIFTYGKSWGCCFKLQAN